MPGKLRQEVAAWDGASAARVGPLWHGCSWPATPRLRERPRGAGMLVRMGLFDDARADNDAAFNG